MENYWQDSNIEENDLGIKADRYQTGFKSVTMLQKANAILECLNRGMVYQYIIFRFICI